MLNSFFQAICRVGIFMICAQAIMHFKAKESYEKYLKLLVSTMILIKLFLPIGNFLAGKSGLQAEDVLEQFNREVEQGMRTAEENAAAADAILEQMTLEEIRNYMEQTTKESGGRKAENGGLDAENGGREMESGGGEKMSKEDGEKNGGVEDENESWENGSVKKENEGWENRGGEKENQGGEYRDKREENSDGEGQNGNRIEIEVEEIEPISIGAAASGE